MDYFYYNTDANSRSRERRFSVLIRHGIAATSGPIRFGESLDQLSPGDVLLMYHNGCGVVAVGTVLKRWDGKTHRPPIYYVPGNDGFEHEYRIKVDWFLDLSASPITTNDLKQRVGSTPRGAVRRIVKWRPEVERLIAERSDTLGRRSLTKDLKSVRASKIEPTTKEALVNARIGQGQFRTQVLMGWGHRCAVTRAVTHEAIRASHIKPWRDCTDEERLDAENGLALVASLDALFDAGLISFESSGRLIVSPGLSTRERKLFALSGKSLAHKVSPRTKEYLAYHREHVFRL